MGYLRLEYKILVLLLTFTRHLLCPPSEELVVLIGYIVININSHQHLPSLPSLRQCNFDTVAPSSRPVC